MGKILLSLPKEAQVSVTQEDVMQAATKGMTLSSYLNEREKTNEALKATGLDAFDAALLSQGIIIEVSSPPEYAKTAFLIFISLYSAFFILSLHYTKLYNKTCKKVIFIIELYKFLHYYLI